jgi:hypothetical protein
MTTNTSQNIDLAPKILDIIQGSTGPIQTRDISAKLFNIYGIKLPTFKVREILWSHLKDEISYRGKPYWDYQIKTKFKIDLKFKNRKIIYITSRDQPLFSIQISHLNSEIIYFINKDNHKYSTETEDTLLFILNAWEKLIMADENGLATFYKYITYLK